MLELIHAKPVINWTAEALQEIMPLQRLHKLWCTLDIFAGESFVVSTKNILYCRFDWNSIFGS